MTFPFITWINDNMSSIMLVLTWVPLSWFTTYFESIFFWMHWQAQRLVNYVFIQFLYFFRFGRILWETNVSLISQCFYNFHILASLCFSLTFFKKALGNLKGIKMMNRAPLFKKSTLHVKEFSFVWKCNKDWHVLSSVCVNYNYSLFNIYGICRLNTYFLEQVKNKSTKNVLHHFKDKKVGQHVVRKQTMDHDGNRWL